MDVSTGKILIAGAIVLVSGVTTAVAVNDFHTVEVKKVPVPGPTVTVKEVREHKIPVPGPTVTKKVVETKTVRPKARKEVSRSNERNWEAPKKSKAPSGSPRDIARQIFGSQFSCADALIQKESSWNVQATNPSSGAYGLPQALPGSKMASAGSDWQTNPATQLRWMKSYVDSRYGGICGAWNHSQANNWY
ncbi:hypothetical protein [Streptomyces althioticus]|uniref:aggregation-promoting factor C-terminal-like domain-containing protein n=1 Tax=Streptomyces althioticus TaxID=83380 RepID=UPI0033DBC95E